MLAYQTQGSEPRTRSAHRQEYSLQQLWNYPEESRRNTRLLNSIPHCESIGEHLWGLFQGFGLGSSSKYKRTMALVLVAGCKEQLLWHISEHPSLHKLCSLKKRVSPYTISGKESIDSTLDFRWQKGNSWLHVTTAILSCPAHWWKTTDTNTKEEE